MLQLRPCRGAPRLRAFPRGCARCPEGEAFRLVSLRRKRNLHVCFFVAEAGASFPTRARFICGQEIGHRVGSHGNGYSANSNVGAPQRGATSGWRHLERGSWTAGPSKFGFRPAPAEEPSTRTESAWERRACFHRSKNTTWPILAQGQRRRSLREVSSPESAGCRAQPRCVGSFSLSLPRPWGC